MIKLDNFVFDIYPKYIINNDPIIKSDVYQFIQKTQEEYLHSSNDTNLKKHNKNVLLYLLLTMIANYDKQENFDQEQMNHFNNKVIIELTEWITYTRQKQTYMNIIHDINQSLREYFKSKTVDNLYPKLPLVIRQHIKYQKDFSKFRYWVRKSIYYGLGCCLFILNTIFVYYLVFYTKIYIDKTFRIK